MSRIFLSPPDVSADERQLLLEAFDSNWIAPMGPHVDAFEREFGDAVGIPYAAALSSGTAALHLALLMIGVGPGDEVITSTLTFAATANAIAYRGATPVFIDSDRETWNMDPDLLHEELEVCSVRGQLPKAALVVDLYGQCADYDRILAVCDEYGVPVIEDAAEALGATYKGKPAGSFGAMAAFSFNGNKIITTSGGGMLVSHRSDWIERARFLATQARDHAPHYQHSEIGYNYRMSNLLAAVGRGQLRHLKDRVRQRRANKAFYRSALGVAGIDFMPEAPYGLSNNWLTCITINPGAFGASSEQIRHHLDSLNIESRPVWKALHLQPAFAHCRARGGKVSEELFEFGLCLPSGSSLSHEQRTRVAEAILEVPAVVAGTAPVRAPKRPEIPRAAAVPREQSARTVAFKRSVLQHGRALSIATQLTIVAIANLAAFALRFDGNIPAWAREALVSGLPVLLLLRAAAFIPFRLFEGLWRYSSVHDLRNIVLAVVSSSVVFAAYALSPLGPTRYPRSILIMDALLAICALGGVRIARRLYGELKHRHDGRRVLVVGAGSAGELVVRDMRQNPAFGLTPIGFIDDDQRKRGRRIHGIPVLGGRTELGRIMAEVKPDEVVVALPSAAASTIRSIVRDLEEFRIPVKTLPTLSALVGNQVSVGQIRQMRMDDLLQRTPVGLSNAPVRKLVAGKAVLITGAGGQIGLEIARQVASCQPSELVLLDRSEHALKQTRDALADYLGLKIVAKVGDVGDSATVEGILRQLRPYVVLHAAAQNDVELMEDNPAEAVRTNVAGAIVMARACGAAGVGRLVLISTVDAVRPSSVAAATRRVAELAIQVAARQSETMMMVVRLGKVLDTGRGPVLTIQSQIRAGGPVTVSHTDVRRYFMLRAEAVQLVLHAAASAERGGVYVLDMGEQIRIADLARHLITLEGLVPDEDIAVRYSGLAPGERLQDDLAADGEIVSPSSVTQVLRVSPPADFDPASLTPYLEQLVAAAAAKDAGAIRELLAAVFYGDTRAIPRAAATPSAVILTEGVGTPRTDENTRDEEVTGSKCPRCLKLTARRSHTRSVSERLRKSLTRERLFRCDACEWRGWMVPLDYAVSQVHEVAEPIDLTALDVATSDVAQPKHLAASNSN
ncbi:MAG TPA: SDR family NAD(P)-dependent oxidoreductase [Gemmatimonadaceae bacterium]|nr:SDR family NAD(P)-dependent oxidoreductase [Gemmatimonadaceae bacterium]